MPNLKYETPDGKVHAALVVHAPGQPGTVVIDQLTGVILTPIMERPDWADGLAVADLAEHRQFYLSRTGTYDQDRELFVVTDLGWLGVNEAGNEIEVDADAEYRMEALATIHNFDRDDESVESFHNVVAEMGFSLEHERTAEEIGALEEAGATLEEKTGTR